MTPPEHVKLYLPVDNRPVTTMHLLVQHGLVPSLHEPMGFVRSLCAPKFKTVWTRIFDGLSARWQDLEDGPSTLAELISRALHLERL